MTTTHTENQSLSMPNTVKPAIRIARQTRSSRIAMSLMGAALIGLVTMPYWGSSGNIRWAIELSCYIAIAQMWNLLAGYAGLVSVGQQAFIGVAGYMLFVLAQNFGINPFIAVPLSLIAPAILSVPTYLLLKRLDGPYFAIGTWVVAEAVRLGVSNIDYLNAGAGLTLRVMTQYSQDTREMAFVWLCALLLLVTVGGSYWLLRSRHGLALTAMRDNPMAAASQGVDVGRLRFLIFVAAAIGTGFAGAIYYMAQLRITPAAGFDPFWGSMSIFIVMVGGIGAIEGAILGALIYFFADRLFGEYGSAYLIVLGGMTLIIALYARSGVWGLLQKLGDHPWFPVRRKLILEEGKP